MSQLGLLSHRVLRSRSLPTFADSYTPAVIMPRYSNGNVPQRPLRFLGIHGDLLLFGLKRTRPAAESIDDSVYLGHQADGLLDCNDALLIMVDLRF